MGQQGGNGRVRGRGGGGPGALCGQAYSDGTDSDAFDAGRRLATTGTVRPGWMCPTSSLNSTQLQAYTFQYCKGQVEVGKSYEIHYVHSSAGMDANDTDDVNADSLSDGLGGKGERKECSSSTVCYQFSEKASACMSC